MRCARRPQIDQNSPPIFPRCARRPWTWPDSSEAFRVTAECVLVDHSAKVLRRGMFRRSRSRFPSSSSHRFRCTPHRYVLGYQP